MVEAQPRCFPFTTISDAASASSRSTNNSVCRLTAREPFIRLCNPSADNPRSGARVLKDRPSRFSRARYSSPLIVAARAIIKISCPKGNDRSPE